MIVHALSEILCGTDAVVVELVALLGRGGLNRLLSGGGRTATEETTEGVADGRADCYTTVKRLVIDLSCCAKI